MQAWINLWIAIGACAAALSLPGTLELAVLSFCGLFGERVRRRPRTPRAKLATAIVVPAHDEEDGIAHCIESLRRCDDDGEPFAILVVADNCSDATAARARAAGAEVLERTDTARRGKGFALEYAFDHLLARDFEILAVVDADSRVSTSFVSAIRDSIADGAAAVQVRYAVANAAASIHARLAHVAWLAFNVLRLRGRSTCGLSVGILGNGFALTRVTLARVPYTARSLVEDLEYHLMLVRAGLRVDWIEAATVSADAPMARKAVGSQRARWEGGRLRVARDHVPALALECARGHWRLVEPLFELLLLPLSMHVALLAVALFTPSPAVRAYAAFGFAVVLAHVLAALVVGKASLRDWLTLLAAPGYVVWKLALLPAIARASGKSAAWVRTERVPTSSTSDVGAQLTTPHASAPSIALLGPDTAPMKVAHDDDSAASSEHRWRSAS